MDLDLYLYKQDYSYFEEFQEKESGEQSANIVKRSSRVYSTFESGNEAISLSQLSPGTYFLVVKANTYGKTWVGVGIEAQMSAKNCKLNLEGFMSNLLTSKKILIFFSFSFGFFTTYFFQSYFAKNPNFADHKISDIEFKSKFGEFLIFCKCSNGNHKFSQK